MTHAWLPFDAAELGGLPAGMTADRYDGGAEPHGIERVEVYVPPYMAPEHTLAVMARMPALRVVQTLTAGVDNVWPHLPAGALLCNARGVHDASTAELVVGLMIASLRRIPEFVRAQESGHLGVRPVRRAGGQAGAHRRLRVGRGGHRAAAGRLRGRGGAGGAQPPPGSAGGRGVRPAPRPAARRRRGRPGLPPHRRDAGARRRRLPRPDARRRAPGERRPRPRRGHRRAAGRAGDRVGCGPRWT